MTSINLYEVLDLKEDCSRFDIKRAYVRLVKECHPDKSSGDKELFELITYAYNTLIDDKSRAKYDKSFQMKKYYESHDKLKAGAKKYYKSIDKSSKNDSTESKQKARSDFDKIYSDMDRKHGLKRSKMQSTPLDKKESDKRLEDLVRARADDDIENMHERIFEEGVFRPDIFNEYFDKTCKTHDELVPHTGNPFAFNTIGGLSDCRFSTVGNYDELYDNSDNVLENTIFGPVSMNPTHKKMTKEEIEQLKGAKYTRGHNKLDDDYESKLKALLEARKAETEELLDKERINFDTNNKCGGYGFLHELADDNFDPFDVDQIDYDPDTNLMKRYEKLKKERKAEYKNL